MHRPYLRGFTVGVFLVLGSGFVLYGQVKRPLTLDDLFRLEQIGRYFGGPIALSPDGNAVAFVIQRAKNTTNIHKQDHLWGNDRADVFIVEGSGTPINITNGMMDGAGYWAPSWSPDGKRLAMLSTKSGNVTLWVWDKASRTLTERTKRGVDLYSVYDRPYLWVSAKLIFCPVLPIGQKPDEMTIEIRAAQKATTAWPNTWTGKAVTASVLQSGVKANLENRPQGELLAIDVETGRSHTITKGFTSDILLSPDRRAIAYLRKVDIYQPELNKLIPSGTEVKYQVEAILINGDQLLPQNEFTYDALPGSLRWSPDGQSLAYASRTKAYKNVPRVFIFRQADRSVRPVILKDLDLASIPLHQRQLEWASEGNLLLLAGQNPGGASSMYARRDWWVVSDTTTPRNATATLKNVPATLLRKAESGSLVGLADGALWRISGDSPPQNITKSLPSKVSSIVWPATSRADNSQLTEPSGTYRQVVVGVQKGHDIDLYLTDLSSERLSPITRPSPQADLIGYSSVSGVTVFRLSDHTGTYLWKSPSPFSGASKILDTNIFLNNIATGSFQKIEYTSLDGQPLGGWLTLPPGYQPGNKYPLIVWLYPGSIAGPSPSRYDDINYMSSLNLQIAAAKGYIVLKPSMPLVLENGVDDPMLELQNGVQPAIDKAIALGIADPQRLVLMGQSFGGYATYGLVTQTNRFKAAVALAGQSDLVSFYGEFNALNRYDDYPHEDLSMQRMFESAQIRMGNPPWKDIGRYLRNSPIFYVDRVQTPVMIIQGDMDYVSMRQGEEFFTALYRQGKRAEFVRYWGEGHVLQSPPNIRDMWHRVFAWFDEFLDISRDEQGNLLWDGDKVKSRNGARPLKPEDFARFDQLILKETRTEKTEATKIP